MSEYAVAAGFIQFDPKDREVNGQDVKDIVIRALGSQKRVYITVWPDHEEIFDDLAKGVFVVAEGKFQIRTKEDDDGDTQEFFNLSASSLLLLEQAGKKERETVNTDKKKSGAKKKTQNSDGVPF